MSSYSNKRNFKRLPFSLDAVTAAVVLSLSCPLYAANAQSAKQTQAIETIEVTARKKVESMQKVPMAIVAVTDSHIFERGIDDVNELTTYVAGLEQPRLAIQSRLSLRGVSSGDNQSFEQAVGMYNDGIYRGRMNQHRAGFFDMQRIEVLKGPQVTLYGNSSIGGAISMISKRPAFEFGGYISTEYEFQYQERKIQGAVNLPISDQLALRIAAKTRQDDGIAHNAFSNENEPSVDDQTFKISALWQPSEQTSVYLRYEQGDYRLDGYPMDVFKHVDANGAPWAGSIYTGLNDGKLDVGNNSLFQVLDTFWQTKSAETLLEIEHQFNSMTFTSITGFSEYDYQQNYDSDWTNLSLINSYLTESYQQFSQEFRLAGDINPQLDYMVGLYYQQDDLQSDFFAEFNMPLLMSAIFSLPAATFEGLVSPFSRPLTLTQDTKQWALLGNVNYEINDKLTTSLSFRYVDIDKKGRQSQGTTDLQHNPAVGELTDVRWLSEIPLLFNPDYLANPTTYVHTSEGLEQPILVPEHLFSYSFLSGGLGSVHDFDSLTRTESHAMFNLSMQYQLTKQSMLYASWANGAKAGGFDLYYEGNNPQEAQYEDEKAKVFELGIKNDWHNLRLNVAAFYGQYKNLQVGIFNGGIGLVVTNAPSSVSKGIDVEFTWRVNESFTAYANMEYLDFYYDHFPAANCSRTDELLTGNKFCDWTGSQAPFVPKFKSSLSLEHFYPLDGDLQLRQLLIYNYKGKHTTASDNEVQTTQAAFGLVDYRIDLLNNDSDWRIGLALRNAFDKKYTSYTTLIPLAPGGAFAHQLEKGRQLALELHYQF